MKRLTMLQRIRSPGGGPWSGLLLELSLGLVWIPCVGPMLSSVLATVRWASGLLLIAFGVVVLRKGMLFAGM
jgi:cytochrome c-type biogenesis protein